VALLVNWFEIRFSHKVFSLPFLDSPTWEDSTASVATYPDAQVARQTLEDGTVRAYFISGKPNNDWTEVSIHGSQNILARIVEFNLAEHFKQTGAEVKKGRWGVDALRTIQEYEQIGLVLKQGVNLKYFAVTEPQFYNGITLNWIVRPSFSRSLANLPKKHIYNGYPVILKWPAANGTCPDNLIPFNGHYLGTILSPASNNRFTVLVRDRTEQTVPADALFLEARTEVIAALEPLAAQTSGQQTIQRRILQLTHSLKSDGRRNPGILRDQLHSALRVIDPASRGEVTVNLQPNCEGKLWVNCFATGVRPAQ
jgi:hypothetical protein